MNLLILNSRSARAAATVGFVICCIFVAPANGQSVPAAPRGGGEPTGACCIGTSCFVVTPTVCLGFNGAYLGNDVECITGECPTRVVLTAVKDNTIYDQNNTTSNGSGDHLFAGNTGAGPERRALVQFNVGAIPPDATVFAAILTLNFSRHNGGYEDITVHRLLNDWGEGASHASGEEGGGATAQSNDATWLYRFYNPGNPGASPQWTQLGGDFITPPSAVTSVGQDVGESLPKPINWTGAQLSADVQGWIDGSIANYGWAMLGPQNGFTGTSKRFDSRNNSNPDARPMLTVYYNLPGPTGACCEPGGACSVIEEAACTGMSGTYQGDGTDCISNPCIVPTGACCLNNGTCQTETEAACAILTGTYQGDGVACSPNLCPIVLEPFVDALPIPTVANPISGTIGGTATYDISIQQVQQKLHRDLPTTTVWGYNGQFPGPTIEAATDEPVTVNWINDLRDDMGVLRTDHYLDVDLCPHGAANEAKTVVHLHGAHAPAAFDGYPEYTFTPGNQDTYIYPNHQQSATLWYHDHSLGITRLNVYMGLAAFYIIRDPIEQSLTLPTGEYEIPLAIQDRTFNADGSLYYPTAWTEHFAGDKILVNGTVWPFLNVKKGKYRFRLLNGCGSRTLTLALSNAASFDLIGTDGGLLPAPVTLTEMTLAPAERADIIIDFSSYPTATEIELTNSAPAPFPGSPGIGVVPQVMKFVVSADTGATPVTPASLRPIETLQEGNSVITRDFELRKFGEPCTGSEWRINSLGWDDITEQPVLGTTEIWRFINRSGMMHPMHMHLVFFQVLDRQPFQILGGEVVPMGTPTGPTPLESGWKDTVQVAPFEIVRVIARFEDYTGLFPYHCHILEHEDHEMMRQFNAICTRGDTNQDTLVNGADIDLFVDTLVTGGEQGTAAFCATDMNGSDTLEFAVDLPMFVDCLLTGNCP